MEFVTYILAAGAAYPETLIDNHEYQLRLNADANKFVIPYPASRRSILPLNSFYDEQPLDSKDALRRALNEPTSLVIAAARSSINRLGIVQDSIGLILGDVTIPVQMTPSEAQRVAGALGLKVPAYDLTSNSVSGALAIDVFRRWKIDQTPDYAMLISLSTPTLALDFRNGPERLVFGDAAGSLIMSRRIPGKLRVIDSYVTCDVKVLSGYKLPTYGVLTLGKFSEELINVSEAAVNLLKLAIEKNNLKRSALKIITNPLLSGLLAELFQEQGISSDQHLNNYNLTGETLGAGPVCILADYWDSFQTGDVILVITIGPGGTMGYVVINCA